MTESQTSAATAPALLLLLSTERTSAERIAALRDLKDSLAEESIVRALCDAARAESSVDVRRALLTAILDIDVTRLADRKPYLDLLLHVCAGEPEHDLRLAATRALATLSPDSPELEEVLAATLQNERSDAIHEAALVGLLRRPDKSPRTLELLVSYARVSPPGVRSLVLQLFRQMQRAACEAGLVALLSPWEVPPLRAALLSALEELPSLSPPAGKALLEYLRLEPRRELRARAARLLGALRDGGPELARAVLAVLAQAPDGAELLDGLSHKLDSMPELLSELGAMLARPGPVELKLKAIALLEKGAAHAHVAAALADANPWVRSAAISASARMLARHPEELGPKLLAAAQGEPLTELRGRIAEALRDGGRLTPESQRALLEWTQREQSPRVAQVLAAALPAVAITDETREPLLRAYLRVLRDPFAGEEAQKAAGDRLRSFAYRDEPALVECLRELLLRASTRDEVEEWDTQLRKLAPDAKDRSGLIRTLLLRFLGDYPAAPTATWARDLHGLAPQEAAVRAEIPLLVALTGESWMLSAADVAEKKSALLPVVRELLGKGKPGEATRLIDEAWNQRTLRKSDLVALLKRLLVDAPGEYGALQTVVQILGKAKLATPEVQDLCLAFLRERPRSIMASTVADFLREVAKSELGYGERVVASFNPEAYAEFCRTGEDPYDVKQVPKTFNDWEYQGWRLPYQGWPLGELFFDLGRRNELHAILSAPPADVPAVQSVQYLVLKYLWQKVEETPEELRALGALAHAAAAKAQEPLRDRAFFLIWKRWKGYLKSLQGAAPPGDLSELATETYLYLIKVRQGFGIETKEKVPEPLAEMDLPSLEKHWTAAAPTFAELREKTLGPALEAHAKELLQLATSFANKGKKPEALGLLERLLGPYLKTKLVQGKKAEIESYRDKARA